MADASSPVGDNGDAWSTAGRSPWCLLRSVGAALAVGTFVATLTSLAFGATVTQAGLVGLAAAGITFALGSLPFHSLLLVYHEFNAWRRKRRFDCWIRMGDQLREIQEYGRAHHWYQRLVDAYPNSIEAWYRLATCLEDAQAFREASQAYERAHEVTSGGDGGLLASAAKCAWEAGDRDRAAGLFAALADRDQSFAAQVLDRDEFKEIRQDTRIRDCIRDDEPGNSALYA